jgi:HSP20 family molecular chaperone IbpA
MSMSPLGGHPPKLSGPGARPSGLQSSDDRAAAEAEREAGRRITHAEQGVEDAQHQADLQLDTIKDSYDRRESSETLRLDEQLDKERLKGYEALRDLQRNQQTEINRVKREGERDLSTLTNYYRDTLYNTERQGSEKLTDLTKQQARSLDFEKQSKDSDVALTHDSNQRQFEEMKAESEHHIQELTDSTRTDYERMRANSATANEKAEQTFNAKFANQLATQDETLLDINNRASQAIMETRRDTSQKLAAYSERQRDPFYKLMDLDAKLHDDGDAYVLTATIPEHEQAHVSVSVKGSQLVLSGFRRNEEKLQLEEGHSQGTNAFQSYLETFPISWPVDANRMTRAFDGDQLSVRVPKKNDYAYHSNVKPEVPRARLERPKFPESLPLAKTEGLAVPPEAGPNRKKGGGTLS